MLIKLNKMKKIILIFCILWLGFYSFAQVAIGKSSVDGSGLLDFAQGTTKGIILPIVETLPAASSTLNGTFLMDKNDSKIKMCENSVWVDLSDTGSTASVNFNTSNDVGVGAIIGASTTTTPGDLVLESSDKALILPKVTDPHINVKSPIAGMMVYDLTSKSLAVYDGLKWNYWK